MTNIIFEPLIMNNKTIPNRFFAQAMEGNDSENGGCPSQKTINRYEELAKGRWGTVLVEAISVTDTSLARVNGLVMNRKNLDGFNRLVEKFRKHNDRSCLLFQITHSGEQSGTFSQKTSLTKKLEGYHYLSTDEVKYIKDDFINAIILAEEAGADGIDLKMCHGYFGSEMIRPNNIRDDKYGKSFDNRMRFLKEIVSEIKRLSKSSDFIIGSRISLYEGIRGGCGTTSPDEIVEDVSEMFDVIRTMTDLGMHYINVSAGIPAISAAITRPTEQSKYLALHHLRYTKEVKDFANKNKLKIKIIGSAYSTYKEEAPQIMEEMINKGYVDLCGFGRQIFADPFTPKKIQNNEKVNWCVLCSGCTNLMKKQLNDGCVVYNNYYKKIIKNAK